MPPTVLIDSLQNIRRRVRVLEAIFGLGILIAAAVVLLLVAIGLDYVLNLPAVPRFVLILLALGIVGYVLHRWIIRPLLVRLSLGEVAARVERAFPQFQDRLRSTVDILTGNLPGSEAMKTRVVFEAGHLAQTIDMNRAVVVKPVWYSSAAGFASLVFALLLMLGIGSQYRAIALSRILLPFGNHPWPKSVRIDLAGPVGDRVAVGQRLDVNIRLARGDRASRRASIYYQYGDSSAQHFGPIEQEYMTRGEDGIYHASLDARIANDSSSATASAAAAGSMKIWMTAGDDQLNLPPVKVVQSLALKTIQCVISPPPYAHLPPITVNLNQNPAIATTGSQIDFTATFNKPLDRHVAPTIDSPIDNAKNPMEWRQISDTTISARVIADHSMRFRLHATDMDGFTNTAMEEFELIVRPDQNPAVQIENPRRNEDRTAISIVPLQILAEDDFGIRSLKLIVDRLGDKKHWEIPLVQNAQAVGDVRWYRIESSADLQRNRASYPWDLAGLRDAQLKPGDVLEYFALVEDNFELNGMKHAPVPSGHLRITILSQEDFTSKVTEELRSIAEQLTQVKTSQSHTQRETSSISRQTQDKPVLDAADKLALDRLVNQQSTSASQAKQLSQKLSDITQELNENKSPSQELKDTAKEVGDLVDKTAEGPMKDAAGEINSARQTASKDERNQQIQQAQANQQQSSDELQKALDRMGNVGTLSRTIDQIKSLLEEQRRISAETQAVGKNNLGKRPEEMSAEDQARLDKNAKDQANLANQSAKALEELQKTAQKLAKADPSSSQAMKDAASTAQQQNVSGNQQKAAKAVEQNQQSQAQSSQKQAELGLQMMLNSLQEAEKHKLEELARKLEDLQKQIANLIRRQSGHNIDNLALQGSDKLMGLDSKLRDALIKDAERDPKNPSAIPDLGAQGEGQELTERNTRDIGLTAEDLPDGAEASDHLTDAADKMARAIVSLRDNKLPEAYDPPQREALAALQSAKKIIDQKKAVVDQKRQDQQKESIRQVYVELKDAQEKLDGVTRQIDSAPRLEDGSLHREDAVRLGQLPGEQGALADRAEKLQPDLSALGSIVYIWANNDLIEAMKQVKDDLAKPDAGAHTQNAQKRVVAQLDAMIRDLMVKPIQSKFAQHSGGGGNGQCSPGLPGETELRLLKDLQLVVNDDTKQQAALPKKSDPDLLALGNRQGELRKLLDQLLRKSSQGQMKLGPEPDNRDQLPEEARTEQIDDQELDKSLLDDKPGAEVVQKDMDLVGDRIARSRQRLAINHDPGKVTQAIQERIVANLDDLIEMARQKQAQTQSDPNAKPQEAMNQPKPSSGVQPQNSQANSGVHKQSGSTPAGDTYHSSSGSSSPDVSSDIHQKMTEWGGITPRQRQAVIEGASEQVIDKYKNLVDDYYRSLASKTNQQ